MGLEDQFNLDVDKLTDERKLAFIANLPPAMVEPFLYAMAKAEVFKDDVYLQFLEVHAKWATSAGGKRVLDMIEFERARKRAEFDDSRFIDTPVGDRVRGEEPRKGLKGVLAKRQGKPRAERRDEHE